MKTTKLFDAETMMARLVAVSDIDHLRNQFYPLLTKNAGRQLNGMGVVLAVQFAIYDYTRGMPAAMGPLMQVQVPDFCGAMIDDAEVLADAKQFFADVEASMRAKTLAAETQKAEG